MNPPLILVVDDKEENRYFLRTLLEGAGYAVAEATHGGEALEFARRERPRLVVADILMPVMDGFALCRHWRAEEGLRSIPFVFYTATYTDDRDRDFALSIGADEFLIKPQEPEELLKRLRNLLQAGASRAGAAPAGERDEVFLRQYNETLVRKLETKMEQLEQDIAARRKAEGALRESQEMLSLFMRHSPIYSFIKQVSPTESRVLVASDNYRQMVGIPGSEMAGKTMPELFPPEFAAKIAADDWSVVQQGGVLKLHEELNGRQYTTIKFPIVWGGKTLLAGYTIDVTEQKQIEQALKDSEARHRELFSNMTSGVAVYEAIRNGEDFRFKDINRAGLVIDGIQREDVIGKAVTEVFPGVREMGLLDVFRRVWKTGVAEYYPATHYVDGRLSHWYENHVYKLPSGEIVAVYDNVTDRKQADEERDRLQAQLNQMQKIESLGRLAGGVAHDFNNMLGAILGHADLALEDLSPEHPLHGHLLEIRKAADRSAALTRQLLAFARKQTVAPKVLDLNETIAGMLQMLRRLIGENIALAWHPGPDLGPVKIDPSQIDQILANLCVNARDAIAGVGTLAIATARATFDDSGDARHAGHLPGEYALIAVSDNGCGMDKETLGKLFEPFFTTKEVGQGTGLGLSTIYGIVKQNHGFVDVDSEPGRGSTFKIYLPCYEEQPALSAANAAKRAAARSGETILLVEDEPSILAIGQALLESLGYQVLGVSTPGEAIHLAQTHPGDIHLLMTDVVMPEMNGRDLAQQILALRPHLKRLFMSGYTADIIAHHGVLADGIHFIQKPFTLTELAAQVRKTLNG